jgi:hypothetical protein
MNELAGILGTFTAQLPPFTDNYFTYLSIFMIFEFID